MSRWLGKLPWSFFLSFSLSLLFPWLIFFGFVNVVTFEFAAIICPIPSKCSVLLLLLLLLNGFLSNSCADILLFFRFDFEYFVEQHMPFVKDDDLLSMLSVKKEYHVILLNLLSLYFSFSLAIFFLIMGFTFHIKLKIGNAFDSILFN